MNQDAPLYRGVNPYLLHHYLPKGENMDTWLLKHVKPEFRDRYTPVKRFFKNIGWAIRYPIDSVFAPLPSGIMYQASYDMVGSYYSVQSALSAFLKKHIKNPLLRGSLANELDAHIRSQLGTYRNDIDFLQKNDYLPMEIFKIYRHFVLLQGWRRDWMIHMAEQLREQERQDALQVYGIRFW